MKIRSIGSVAVIALLALLCFCLPACASGSGTPDLPASVAKSGKKKRCKAVPKKGSKKRKSTKCKKAKRKRTRRPVGKGGVPGGVAEGAYDIGSPTLRDIWIDPTNGSDSRSGDSRGAALKTLAAAWEKVPHGTQSGTGVRMMIAPGTLSETQQPNYWDEHTGTAQFPIIVQAADGPGTVNMAGINAFGINYLYLIDLNMNGGGDVVHCEQCEHLLLRGLTVRGKREGEVVKINQSKYVYIENSDIAGAGDNSIDFVAVQYGHILANKVHDSVDWCAYTKGGSAYIRVAGNEFYDCGTGGYTAGQGTGFQFMSSPWLGYEAYDIKVYNNVIHDTEGAGLGVNGGFNILMAYNTLYRVGKRSHVLEVVYGLRSCDGHPGDDGRSRCGSYLAQGGWGTTRVDDGTNAVRIPDRNVYIYNNVIFNPSGYRSEAQQFAIHGAYSGGSQAGSNVPSPAHTDDNLQIRGNVVWNGSANMPLGVGDDQGCGDGNPTCNAAQLRADNRINAIEPQLVNPANGDFKPADGGNLFSAQTFAIPDFTWNPQGVSVAQGNLSNSITKNRVGQPRNGTGPPGAY